MSAIVNQLDQWPDLTCPNNKNIRYQMDESHPIGWNSGSDCYKYAKKGLREKIEGGDPQASNRVCTNGIAPCCKIWVETS